MAENTASEFDAYIQAMVRAWTSAGLSVIREVVFGAGLTVIMPLFMGLDGVLWSMPVSDALTFIVSVIVIVIIYRELGRDYSFKV